MNLLQVRPLGCRENLVAFELYHGLNGDAEPGPDVRAAFTLWDPQGRPHQPVPTVPIERAISGRELLQRQEQAWRAHVARARHLFGSAPLAGAIPADRPLRGLLAFQVEIMGEGGRWTLTFHDGRQWRFSTAQLRRGAALPALPAS